MLLCKVSFYSHVAPWTLLEITLLRALVQLVIIIGTDLNDLGAGGAIRQQCTLKHIMEVHFIGVNEIW